MEISLHEDPILETFTLRLALAEANQRIASLEADVQVYRAMNSVGYEAVAMLTKERDRLRASNARLLDERRAQVTTTCNLPDRAKSRAA